MDPVDDVTGRVLAEHRETVVAVLDAADEAGAALEQPADRATVVAAMGDRLGDRVRGDLVALLRDAVDAADRELQADPVPAPPYVVVTARGPLVRATLGDARLVVLVRAFDHEDGGYVRADVAPEEAVEVRFRRRP